MIKLVILFYGFGDLITTYLALDKGYTEQNPIGAWLLEYGFIYMILAKIFVISCVYFYYNSKGWWILQGAPEKFVNVFMSAGMVVVIIIGIATTINNSLLCIR